MLNVKNAQKFIFIFLSYFKSFFITSSNSPKNNSSHHNSNNSNGNNNNSINIISNQNNNSTSLNNNQVINHNSNNNNNSNTKFGQAVGSLLRRLSGSRANSQTRLNKISQDRTGQLGGSRTSLAKLGKPCEDGTGSLTGTGNLVKKNFSASVQCLQNISGSRVNISNILNSSQTSSNAHLFYTKNTPAPLVRGPGLNPKYRLAKII